MSVFQDRKLADAEHKVVGMDKLQTYFLNLWNLLCGVQVWDETGQRLKPEHAMYGLMACMVDAHVNGGKVIFIGNGGSASIASHMAADWSKNGGLDAISLNDPAMLTCLANDLGYENVFSQQIEMRARKGDVLIAISSSGRSSNILLAAQAAKAAGCHIATMSGFDDDNPLRWAGRWNFHVRSDQYGFVEIAHLTLCHAMLDFLCTSKEKAAI